MNPRKDVCKNGHKYGEHRVTTPKGESYCRACRRLYNKTPEAKERIKGYSKKNYLKNKEKIIEASKKYAKKNPDKVILLSAKHRALRKGLEFNLTLDYISSLLKPEACPVLGIHTDQWHLDRKDNSKGYIEGNVFFISRRANVLKSDGTIEEFIKIIDYMRHS